MMTLAFDLEQAATASRLGYAGPDAVRQMNEAHDPIHVVASRLLGIHYSPTLHWVTTGHRTHPTRHDDAVGFEEALTMELQRWQETGQYGDALRVVWLLGHLEEDVHTALRNAGGNER